MGESDFSWGGPPSVALLSACGMPVAGTGSRAVVSAAALLDMRGGRAGHMARREHTVMAAVRLPLFLFRLLERDRAIVMGEWALLPRARGVRGKELSSGDVGLGVRLGVRHGIDVIG